MNNGIGFASLQHQLAVQNEAMLQAQVVPRPEPEQECVPIKKMPVSYLQELCGRKQVTCVYQLRATEGMSHDPVFVIGVDVDDLSGFGRAKNKKIAKHLAAREVLYRIVENNRYTEWGIQGNTREEAYQFLCDQLAEIDNMPGIIVDYPSIISVPADGAPDPVTEEDLNEANAPNPVSKLLELSMQRRWPAPQFSVCEESGMPHDKTFVMKVQLGVHETTGTAKTKKTAKRLAAEIMLSHLHQVPLEERDKDLQIEMEEEEETPTNAGEQQIGSDEPLIVLEPAKKAHNEIAIVGDGKSESYMNSFGGMFSSFGLIESNSQADPVKTEPEPVAKQQRPGFWDELISIDLEYKPTLVHKNLLQKIALENQSTITYDHLAKRSKNGLFQCIVSMTKSTHCGHGSGDTLQEAECDAALNILEILRMDANGEL